MNSKTRAQLEAWLGEKIINSSTLEGGNISTANQIHTQSGQSFFLKTAEGDPTVFFKEANGLRELTKTGCIRIPEVLHIGESFLLLEFLAPGNPQSDFFEKFGRQFAEMHRYTSTEFGFYEDNFLGSTEQKNIPTSSEAKNWSEFYLHKRLLFQFYLAEEKGYATTKIKTGFRHLENRIDQILEGSEEPPTLLHGDLWSGNFLVGLKSTPCLIDPAVYYGHREADLAMTKLFGGFQPQFYEAYQESFPLLDGYQERENIYLLYHVMNHLNLFGNSYYTQAVQLLESYL